ncbi:MAG: hypothetical protein CMF61_06940 [Magnetococcales bacterium]|nr:hypothetical protein [Magnetococcales bacterium]
MKKNNLLMQIGKRKIGPEYKPIIIVELGINHNGSLKKAKQFVDQAKKYGAEIIKHQTHIPEDEMSIEAKKIIPSHTKENIFDIIKKTSLSEADEFKLMKYVKSKKMLFISTPFSRLAVDRLVKFKVPAFKIGSGECNNYPLIEYIASHKKPIILSTGMNTINSIKPSVKIFEKYKIPYALMHCTNIYPTPTKLIRLQAITELKKAFPKARCFLNLPAQSDYFSAPATTAALVALAGTTGAVGSASAVASVSSIGDQSTIGSSSTISSDVDPMNTSSSDASSPPSYTEEPITSSGGSGSGEALSGLGGSSALSGDAQQAVMIEEFAEISSQRIDTGESRAEAGVGLAQTTKAFREMEASTKLQDDIEITHAKALSLVLMGS